AVMSVVLVSYDLERSAFVFFFFSSRRRHTRSKRDWSSDVCYSDLVIFFDIAITLALVMALLHVRGKLFYALLALQPVILVADLEIGRASCRERVWLSGGARSVKGRRG